MSSALGFVRRNLQLWVFSKYGEQKKADGALKFGILGAAKIAPMALILPAKSHPEVIVQAIAARDKTRATAYAKKHGIPQVFDNYQALLDDASIDAVYIPLPNGLHFEWALKALATGKHVLLEKPSGSNAAEAEMLFRSPLATQPNAPVLLEAFHYRFQPAWARFLALLDPPRVHSATTDMWAPPGLIGADDIRFDYDLAGGALTDLGTYNMSVLRAVFAAEPAECLACDLQAMDPPRQLCDYAFDATFCFPNGGTGRIRGSLLTGLREYGPSRMPPSLSVTHAEVADDSQEQEQGTETVRIRTVTFDNFIFCAIWHRIVVEDEYIVRERPQSNEDAPPVEIKRWTTREVIKAYTFEEAGMGSPTRRSEAHWLSYRYQLEEFVNRIRGRPGSGLWVDAEDSIAQMRMIDMTYAKSNLPLRKTSEYRPEAP